jgi:superfamily II DNA or RNA helicase
MDFNPYDAEFVEEVARPGFALRSYQREWMEATARDRASGFTRLLLDAPGGCGKSTYFAAMAKEEWLVRGGRTLIIENRQQLVNQAADRIRNETGLDADIEMGSERASPHAPIVVASIATLGRVSRLTSFSDQHFSLVVIDECHHGTAPLCLRAVHYFHYGAASLAEEWTPPKDGTYAPKACIIGTTATPDVKGKRHLGTLFQKFTARYSYLQAIEDGWLVGIKEVNIPVRVDLSKFKAKNTSHGTDFSDEDNSAAIIPIIEELSEQIVAHAKDRKTMCFLPSLECAQKMADALNRRGLKALYCSGVCLDKDTKTEEFQAHGKGICLCLCALYTEGTDFPDVDTIAWMRATLSPIFYKQGLFRETRVLKGVVSDEMTAEQRRAAIAASPKPYGLLISPFFVSDRNDLCSVVDLFLDRPELKEGMKKKPTDMTDAAKIRDFIEALEKAADKHRNRQPRTIDPVRFSVSIGADAIAHYVPENAADAAPPNKAELDYILGCGLSSVDVKTSGQAQLLIQRLQARERLGLASPKTLQQLTLRLGWPAETASMMKQKQAAMLMVRGVRYKRPVERPAACYCNATSHPPCSFCESGAGFDV